MNEERMSKRRERSEGVSKRERERDAEQELGEHPRKRERLRERVTDGRCVGGGLSVQERKEGGRDKEEKMGG